MGPVEIDIRLRENVAKESERAATGIRKLGEEAKKAQEEVRTSIAIQKKVLQDFKRELAGLEQDLGKIKHSQDPRQVQEKERLTNAVKHLRSEIKLEEKALTYLERKYKSLVSSSQNLETEMRNTRNAMASLKMQGKENTQEYKVLEERLGLLGTAYRELTATQKALSTGGSQMAGVLSALNAVSGAFTATAGAVGLVNTNSEAMEKIQTRVQSLMAITIGLQQVSNTLHKTSAFRITTVAKVKELWAIANKKVATTLALTNVQAQILMGTLTLGLSVAITFIATLINNYITKQREAAEATQEFNDSVSETATGVLVKYEAMRKEWERLGDSLEDKEKYIQNNKKAFNDLGIAIGTVNEADNLFVENTEAFKASVMQRAKATAYMEIASEKYKEAIHKQLELDKMPDKVRSMGMTAPNFDKLIAEKELKGIEAEADKIIDTYTAFMEKSRESLQNAGVSTTDEATEEERRRKAKEKAREEAQRIQKKEQAEKEQAEKNLASLSAEIEKGTNASILAIMEDGREKRMAQIDAEYRERMAKIKQQRTELMQLEEDLGRKAPETHIALDEAEFYAKTQRQKEKDAVNIAFNQEATKEWEDLLAKYETYEDKKSKILKKYADDRAKIEAKNTDGSLDGNLRKLEEAKAKEILVLEKSAGNIKSTIAEIFGDLSEKSTAELDEILQKAEGVLSFLQSGKYTEEKGQEYGIDEDTFNSISKDPTVLKTIRDLIQKLKGNAKTLGQHFKTLFKKDVSREEFEQSFGKVNNEIQSAIQLTNMFASTLSDIAEMSGSKGLGKVAEGFSMVADVAGSAMQGAQAGMAFGPAGAAIGAGLGVLQNVVGRIAKSEKAHREALARIRRAELQGQREYNRLLFEQKMLMKDKNSIFGVDAIAKAVGYLEAYNQSLILLQAKMKKSGRNFKSDLDKIEIETGRRRSGFMGWGKGKAVYTSITKYYSDLIDSEGRLNVARAKQILTTRQMSQEHKEALQEIIRLYEQMEQAQDRFSESLKDVFGALGSDILDSVINSLRKGEDAFDTFAKSVGNVMGKLGKQIMYELFVSSRFKDFQKQLTEIYKNGTVYKEVEVETDAGRTTTGDRELTPYDSPRRRGNRTRRPSTTNRPGTRKKSKVKDEEATLKNIGNKVRDAVGVFANNMKAEMNAMKQFGEIWKKETKKMGFDVWGNEDEKRRGMSKGIAQASQDSIDDVLGRLYALTRFVNEIRGYERLVSDGTEKTVSIQSAMLSHLQQLVENTAYNKYLQEIAKDIEEMKQQGIRLKV